MSNQIVIVNVSQQIAPKPSQLQKTGVFISQGGTNKAAGTSTLLTQLTDLTAILAGSKAIASMTLAAGIVTVTTIAPHGFPLTEVIPVLIGGVTPAAYNGTQTATITGANTFT